MREYYEDLWERLPVELRPPEFELRSRWLGSELQAGDRLLDLGCGDGQFAAFAATRLDQLGGGEVVGVDVAEAALARARAGHHELGFERVGFDEPLPFADGSFDLIWASEVIEHVADTARWLSEIRRVLAPRGRLLLTTPAHGRLRVLLGGIERFSPPLGDHLHLYTGGSLRELLHEFDFDELRVWAASGPPTLRRTLFARGVR